MVLCKSQNLLRSLAAERQSIMENMTKTTVGYAPILQNLSRVVRGRRADLGLSQDELSHRSGLHRTYISDIERGARNLSLKNLVRLAEALEVQASTLMSWVEGRVEPTGPGK